LFELSRNEEFGMTVWWLFLDANDMAGYSLGRISTGGAILPFHKLLLGYVPEAPALCEELKKAGAPPSRRKI